MQNDIHTHKLWNKGASFIIGVSGGADSTALLDILAFLAPKYDLRLVIAHMNYRLRGKDSDEDERFVRSLAKEYGLPFKVLRPRIPKKGNLEENLRTLRYDFFEKLRKQYDFEHIATAHQKDDQAETFLLRLFRGSGLDGLSSIPRKNNVLVRPLLNISREDILSYLASRHLSFRTDTSNADTRFLRNRVRNELLPLLEGRYEPAIRKNIALSAELLSKELSRRKNPNIRFFPLLQNKQEKSIAFEKDAYLSLSRTEKKRLFTFLLSSFKQDQKSLSNGVLLEIDRLLFSQKSKTQTFYMKGLKLLRKGDKVTLIKSRF